MTPDARHIETLSTISTATLTTVLRKKGLRNVQMRGTRPLPGLFQPIAENKARCEGPRRR